MALFKRKSAPAEVRRQPDRESIDQEQEIPTDAHLIHWIDRLKRGAPLSDRAFDAIFPGWTQTLSPVHWTPIEVIQRAVELLVGNEAGRRVLDVGSGAGKFCLVAALISEGRFSGIEQREHFYRVAQAVTRHYQIPRVTFLHGNFQDLDWSEFESIYLFNPFQENQTPEQRLDDTVPLSQKLYRTYVDSALQKLTGMREGTRVVTYHGFGGTFPGTYTRKFAEWCYRGPFEYWEKTR